MSKSVLRLLNLAMVPYVHTVVVGIVSGVEGRLFINIWGPEGRFPLLCLGGCECWVYVVVMSAHELVLCYHPYRENPYKCRTLTVVLHFCDTVGVGVGCTEMGSRSGYVEYFI